MSGGVRTPGASVASRLLAVLGAFDGRHRSLTLSDLARRADLPLATTFRLVGELVAWGALAREASGAYVIGRRIWDLGLLAPDQAGLREIASPFLHDVYGATLATVHLAVREDVEVLYLDRLMGHRSTPIVSSIGSRLPMHPTAVGKVLLAHAPSEIVTRVCANLVRVTPYTVTRPARLQEDLARVRRDGYAVTTDEMSMGACSVAVPVIVSGRGGGDDAVVAAVGAVVPSLRRDRARLLAALQMAARGIGRSVGESR